MEITNELLAAYAEGNVTPEERKQVRAYLTEHPSQLESVMLMMDSDDDFGTDSEVIMKSPSHKIEYVIPQETLYNSKNILCDSIGISTHPQQIKDFNQLMDEILNDIDK